MSYGLKYLCSFDQVNETGDDNYSLQILEKNTIDSGINVTGGAVPVLHQWQTDDPKAPVKGSNVNITLVNQGDIRLTDFFSVEDDHFLVKLFYKEALLFTGFIVQDDCSETMVDFTHEINLSATDNLGLLKDIALDKAQSLIPDAGGLWSIAVDQPTHSLTVSDFFATKVKVGDEIKIIGTTTINGDYTVTNIVHDPPTARIDFAEYVPDNYIGDGFLIIFSLPDFYERVTLLSLITSCLKSTGLDLNINVWSRLNETTQDANVSFLQNIMVDPQTFLRDQASYDDCYTVLTKILGAFKMSLFQANGIWNIIRWDELRYYSGVMAAYSYSSAGTLLGFATMGNKFTAGLNELTQAETGILQKILRPYSYVKETFNYKQPRELLRNFDLQQLGRLLNTYTTGSGADTKVIKEYEATWWEASTLPVSTTGPAFIRVTSDNLGNEVERTFVVEGDVKSYKIEVNANDSFKFAFSFRTEDSQPGNLDLVMIVQLTNGSTTNYLHEDTGWQTGVGYVYNIPSGDNSNTWHSVEIDATKFAIPFDGLLYCYLRVADLSAPIRETYYKDIRFDYTSLINESTKIIGQTHTSSQPGLIKQNEDDEIFIDTSPRNSIAGTLFTPQFTGVLQNRAQRWHHDYLGAASFLLGNIITFEEMFWRRKPRTILDGTLYGVVQSGKNVSLLSVFNYTLFPNLNLIWGTLEIDYRNNHFTGTLWEMYEGSGYNCRLYTFALTGFPPGAWSISGIDCDGNDFNYSSISGSGTLPSAPICARVGSITTAGPVTVTEGAACGAASGEADGDFVNNYMFTYLYANK